MKYIAMGLLCVLGFVWGVGAHRNKLFPYHQLRGAALALNLISRDRVEIAPRSSQSARERLETLGYLQSSPIEEDNAEGGVVIDDTERSFAGLNFYKEIGSPSAHLINNEGVEFFSWQYPDGNWVHAELEPERGALIGISKDDAIFRLSAESQVEWKTRVRGHHDLDIRADGSIWALTRKDSRWPERYGDQPIVEDFVTVLSPDGEILQEISLLDSVKRSPYEYLLPALDPSTEREQAYDVLHVNHVEVFDGSQVSQSELFRDGNLLISLRTLNAIAILAKDSFDIQWLWGPTNLSVQHHPQLLENGNILIFDNGFEESRVVEITVPGGKIVWEYSSGPDFFSNWGGSVQRLPNGNTLITSSRSGIAFEVTPAKRIVWKFVNPRTEEGEPTVPEGKKSRWNIWRMTRYPKSALSFLSGGA